VTSRPAPLTVIRPGVRVSIACSERSDGDFHLDQSRELLDATRRRFVDLPWSQPEEVHGATVLVVERPGHHDCSVADALVSSADGAVLGIWVGDCAPVALVGDDGSIGAVHAGWRGLEAGVLHETVAAMRSKGARQIDAVLGPCIHPCCYEFGYDDLDRLMRRFGSGVVGRTASGRRALDMPAAVRAALSEVTVALDDHSVCTGCRSEHYFSHRVRAERGRQVMAVWRHGLCTAQDPT
jgi:YfiH family protein